MFYDKSFQSFFFYLLFFKYSFCLTKIVSITSESLEKAFAGIDTLVYVASKTYSVFDRVGELENVLAAMKTISCSNELYFVRRFCRSDGHNSS
ncbi:hypothetical protein HMPREF0492_1401 [Lactobacillus acidophilus ATCC 4796]|nr:hypothetical protein HMPREF0492_1401 [Lactobacillus acidophilus ATCC 4796]